MSLLIEDMWDEWSACPVEGRDRADAECAGLLCGLFSNRGDPLRVGTSRLWLARRLLRTWRGTSWSSRWNIADGLSLPSDPGGRVRLRLPQALRDELAAFPDSLGFPLGDVRWAWLRGLWGSCGGLYLPRTGYYLALRLAPPSQAAARRFLRGTRLPWRERDFRGAREMMLRDQEAVVTFLYNIGLPDTSLRLEDKAIVRSMKDQANRARNCDTANIRRALRVAEGQTELALKAAREGLLPLLPPALRELAEARLRAPEASLSELGEKLVPPITKSTVKYRWDRLRDYISRTMGSEA